MARKYDLISDLYRRTAEDVVSDPVVWQAFLRSASRNYRLRFDEQLLLFAQRPDATAVLSIERWNNTFGRWVNRGAKGIAVFENTSRSRQRLVHYFDISDTHESRYSHPVPIWQMQAAYTDAVVETLENTFGKLQDKENLQSAVLSAVQNAVEDNLPDYLQDFMRLGGDSDLAYLSGEEANDLYQELVLHSTAFMVLSRLGADTSELYPPDFFDGVSSFNTPETVNALGVAISDISEMALGEIARTVWTLNKKDRILAENEKAVYNQAENQTERSFEDERTDLHTPWRLQPAGSDGARSAGRAFGQVRTDAAEIFDGASQDPLLQSPDELHPDTAPGRNTADSAETGRDPAASDGREGRPDREPESGGYDGLGTENEQSEKPGAGDRADTGYFRLDYYDWGVVADHFEAMRLLGELQDTAKLLPSVEEQLNFLNIQAEETPSAFSFSQEIIDTILLRGSGIADGKFRIYRQFETSLSAKENAEFLKEEYGWGGVYPVIAGSGIAEQHDAKGIHISKNDTRLDMNWRQAEKRIGELIQLDRYLSPKEKELYPQWLQKQEQQPTQDTSAASPADKPDTAESVLLAPAAALPKRSRVQTFDLHPEIPLSERHTFDLASHEVPEAGKKERFRRNMEAIRVLKECEFENRFATPEEQEILSQYVGWGGIPEAFDENNSSWADEFIELYTALSPDEYESARASTLTAFYTPPVVISSIYKAMEQMGFREGNILEPSCGIGNFIGMLPQSMQDSKIYGVEIDKISAGIAQQLYQKTSIAAQPFEEANIPDSFFDAVIGNVPFGDIRVNDRRYNKHNFLIHDYFFAKSLDKLRPGGVMALITSKGTMDKESPAVRKYIAQRADLLGAIRLPNNTFKGNAGTEVVSDILILQKRDRLIDLEPEWVHLNTDENGVKMNTYFVDHPEMVLGEWKTVSGRFGEEDTVVPYENADLAELLEEAISNIHAEITDYEVDEELTEEDNSIPADPEVRNFSYTVVDDKIYYRENSRMAPVDVSATAENRIKGMIAIRDCVRNLIEMQTADYPDYEVEKEQQKLNELYDTFSKKYGLINSRANVSAFSQDSSFALLSALEVLDENGELERKADMFTKRTIKPHTPVTSVDTASEALAVSMGEKACVDMEYMCSLTGKTEQEIYGELKGVIFLNPMYGYGNSTERKYLMADEYLSGNVREKLAWAKKSAEVYPEDYNINVEALEKVQPKDLTASEIFVQLGTTWLPEEIAQQFMYEFLDTPVYARWNIKVHYSKLTGEWNVEGKSYDRGNLKAYNTYGTKRVNAYKIIEDTLNMKDVRVFDYMEDDEGKKRAILNKKETAIAQSKQELIKQGFQDWVWRDPARREKLVRLYNDKFNSIRPREYDGSHITFSGMNPEIELREHQKNAVAHILYGGNTLLAHAVGAGKTFEMTAAAMESKRLGLCNKSLFVVPNHLTEQWAAEFLQLYPAANILVATKKDFEMKNRKRFCGRIATGDYDAVIIGHSQFEKIPISIERQRAVLEQQLSDIIEGIADIKQNRGDRFSVKQLEKTKKSLQTKLEKLNDQSRKDDVVTFEELGIDRIFIDESHYYKNLYLYTKMRNVGGIAQTEAQKSSDLFMKCRYLDEITGGRGVVFATGTPISNSMVELYTIQRYLQYRTLQEHDLQHFDAWASMFGETVTAVELTPEGTGYRAKTRFAKFNNLPELMAMFKQVADIKTADMLNLPVPEVEYHNIAVKPSQVQKEMVASLGERAEKIRGGGIDSSVDNMLKVTNDGRKLALDQRMMNPMLPDDEGSKVNACVNEVFHLWEENSDKRLTQLLFCDLSTPKGEKEFSVYTDIRKKLIERGIPESEIKFIHEADTETKKQELFKKVRRGEVRILMGSTQKMGAGTNVQNKIIASHDLDCPWRPADLEQRAGRTVRQGNENPKVGIYRYVTEGTFDAYCWQLVEGKQKFSSQIMTSKSPVRSCEDVDATALSYAEIKMLAADNPHIKEKMDLDIQVQKLRLLKSNYLSEKYELEDKIIKYYPTTIARIKETIAGLEKDRSLAKEYPKPLDDTFVGIEVKGVSYSEKAEGGQKIIDACKEMTSPDPVPLGKYRGFDLELSFDTFEKAYQVKIKGSLSRSVSLGTDAIGNITRIDNAIAKIPEQLEAKKQELETLEQQFATAKKEVEKPFDKEEELTEKTNRLNVLNGLLNVDKRENELVDSAPDAGDNVPTFKDKAYER